MVDEKVTKPTKAQKLLRVYPKAFAVDEKFKQSLVIFEDAKGKISFSVALGAPEQITGLVKDGMQKTSGLYSFAQKLLETFQTKPKKAIIKAENEIDLCLKQEDIRGLKKLQTGMTEMLGMWNLYDFPIYSKPEFIESIRHIDLQADRETLPPAVDLYKVYGQKYLM